MSGSYAVTMGERGRFVLPKSLRDRMGLLAGTPLVLIETPHGVVVATREQAEHLVQGQLAGPSLVAELIADRRAAAAEEDA